MLALITGRGGLPIAVAEALATRPLVCALNGQGPDGLIPDITFRIEHLGTLLSTLKSAAVTDVCLCGSIDRPRLDLDKVDTATAPLLPVLAGAVASGEDSALRAVIGIFEQAGFGVRAAHDLAPDLLPPAGLLTSAPVPQEAGSDVALALRVLEAHGAADLGQSCVIQNGTVLAREDARGTDAMLEGLGPTPVATDRPDPFSGMMDMAGDLLGDAADWLSGDAKPDAVRAGMLFKAPKPGQDHRIDLPTIGPVTAEKASAAGLAGIVIAQGGVIVLEQARVLDKLNAAGMYLWVR
ncbi:LpxI family protein [Tateyamaria pelophila]|uniref:LpxI family protein n=1 Tax=Tateyamaria pelophila TaxID=328415 RepID=UPI001CBA7656|nr:UDP-2,3-diacylglucosamine diphosphatase LpxI [Tateyamaria pelophila]